MSESAKKQLVTLSIAAILFFIAAALIVLFTDPFKTSIVVFVLFFMSVAAFCISFFTVILFSIRKDRDELLQYQKMRIAVRESVLLAIFLVGSLLLSAHQLTYWWIETILATALVLIEIFFLL